MVSKNGTHIFLLFFKNAQKKEIFKDCQNEKTIILKKGKNRRHSANLRDRGRKVRQADTQAVRLGEIQATYG